MRRRVSDLTRRQKAILMSMMSATAHDRATREPKSPKRENVVVLALLFASAVMAILALTFLVHVGVNP
jgi:hypothetical protein